MQPKQVLFVCLGNICRSPAAEGVMQHLVDERGLAESIQIDSAGTSSYHIGEPADARMRASAAERGIELTSRSRMVAERDFERFDLVIAMDSANYHSLEQTAGGPTPKLKMMSDYLEGEDRDKYPSDVLDPYYGEDDGFGYVLDMLQAACPNLLKELSQAS